MRENICKTMLINLGAVLYCLSPVFIEGASAREAALKNQQTPDSIVAQATLTAQAQPSPPRPRTRFFEQESKQQFGFGSFLDSALDGGGRIFSSDPITDLSGNAVLNPLSDNRGFVTGTLAVENRTETNPNFLRTTFSTPGVANLTFSNAQPSSDPRTGTVTINGTAIVNGRPITFNNVPATYSGSFSSRDNNVSGAIQVVNPSDPTTSIFIQLPPTQIPNVDNPNQPLLAPAQLSIGLPTDR